MPDWGPNIMQYVDNYYARVSKRAYLHSNRYKEIGMNRIEEGNRLLKQQIDQAHSNSPQIEQIIQEQKSKEQIQIKQLFDLLGENSTGSIEQDLQTLNRKILPQISQDRDLSKNEFDRLVHLIINGELPLNIHLTYLSLLEEFLTFLRAAARTPTKYILNCFSEWDIEDSLYILNPLIDNLNRVIQINKSSRQKIFELTIEEIKQVLLGNLTQKDIEKRTIRNLKNDFRLELSTSVEGSPDYKAGDSIEEQIDSLLLENSIIDKVQEEIANSFSEGITINLNSGKMTSRKRSSKVNFELEFIEEIELTIDWKISNSSFNKVVGLNLGKDSVKPLQIREAGTLSDFIEDLSENELTKQIGQLFQNNLFRYFLANELFTRASGEKFSQTFFTRFYSLMRYGAYTYLGDSLEEIKDDLSLNVNFLFIGAKIIPVSVILEEIYSSRNLTRGVQTTVSFEGDRSFLNDKANAISQLPRNDPSEWYQNENLLSVGYNSQVKYINGVQYSISITKNVLRDLVARY